MSCAPGLCTDPVQKEGRMRWYPPANDTRYMREALREGLRIELLLGTNPFVPGFIGSTDTHIGAAGGVEEDNYGGHHGDQVITLELPLDRQLTDRPENNPGGLAVLYAEENTRPALFVKIDNRSSDESRTAKNYTGSHFSLRSLLVHTLSRGLNCQVIGFIFCTDYSRKFIPTVWKFVWDVK